MPEIHEHRVVLSVQALGKHYRAGSRRQRVLENINLDVARGEFIVLLGRSGSGKSTLLNLIGAMDRPTTGRVVIDGEAISDMPERHRTAFRRRRLGFIFQAYNLIPTLSVRENVELPLRLNDLDPGMRADELLAELGLGDKHDAAADTLSGGEQQRVAIARALAHAPGLVLADEPTGNLDIDTARTTIALLDRLVRQTGTTLIMATHSREVIGYADRVFRITPHGLAAAS